MKRILILGAGRFAEEAAEILHLSSEYELIGFTEGIDRENCRTSILGYPVYWIGDIPSLSSDSYCIAAIGSVKRADIIAKALVMGMKFTSLIHPTASISSTAGIGKGCLVNPLAVIASGANISEHVVINRGCLIGHHTQIGTYSTVSPGANIAGNCLIGSQCYIGMGAVILDGIRIGDGSVVGAGAVVTKEVPPNVQVTGIPARISKSWS